MNWHSKTNIAQVYIGKCLGLYSVLYTSVAKTYIILQNALEHYFLNWFRITQRSAVKYKNFLEDNVLHKSPNLHKVPTNVKLPQLNESNELKWAEWINKHSCLLMITWLIFKGLDIQNTRIHHDARVFFCWNLPGQDSSKVTYPLLTDPANSTTQQ